MDAEFRFADAKYALDMKGDQLRNWLKLGKVTILNPYGGGWSKFTLGDLVHIAMVRVFVDLGRRVEEANTLAQMAGELIESNALRENREHDAKIDLADPISLWDGRVLYVIRQGGKWTLGITEQRVYLHQAIIIDMGAEIRPVVERARARLQERQGKAAA